MDDLSFYLLKSVSWLSAFAAIYALFLRNERYFILNRLFLLLGIVCALVLPWFTWRYAVPVSAENPITTGELLNLQLAESTAGPDFNLVAFVLLSIYLLGSAVVIILHVRRTWPVLRLIHHSEPVRDGSVKLIYNTKYPDSFSFFSFVFVNPSIHEREKREIVNHEQEHIRQKHWIDLLLLEILCVVQWFNPLVWLYGRQLRQNQEYLADRFALKRSSNPAVYRATLLNQLLGGDVIPLSNSFNYSRNKKRFNMMTHIKQSPYRMLKLLLIIPVIGGIFYAFSAPKYVDASSVHSANMETEIQTKIGSISWQSQTSSQNNLVYSTNELNQALGLKPGDAYAEKLLEERMYGTVSDLYMDHGYLFFNIEKSESLQDDGTVDLTFKLYEGQQAKIRNIDIEGNDKVSDSKIKKQLAIKPGDLFSRSKCIESIRTLSMLFDPETVQLEPAPDFDTQGQDYMEVDLKFYVDEI